MTTPRFRIQAMTRDRYGLVPNPREVPAEVLDEEIPKDGIEKALALGVGRSCLIDGPKFAYEVRRIA